MKKFFITLFTLSVCLFISSCKGDSKTSSNTDSQSMTDNVAPVIYESTLEDGIFFNREGIPNFIEKIEGMYPAESFGSWTDGSIYPSVKIYFKENPPKKFDLNIVSCGYKDNAVLPVSVNVGPYQQNFTPSPCWDINEKKLTFSLNSDEKIIEITPPKPISPADAEGIMNDPRLLGLGIYRIYITIP